MQNCQHNLPWHLWNNCQLPVCTHSMLDSRFIRVLSARTEYSLLFLPSNGCVHMWWTGRKWKQSWRYAADWLAGPQCQNSIQTLSDTQWSNKCRLQFSTMQELQSARCYTRSIQPNATFHTLSHESIICVVPPLPTSRFIWILTSGWNQCKCLQFCRIASSFRVDFHFEWKTKLSKHWLNIKSC